MDFACGLAIGEINGLDTVEEIIGDVEGFSVGAEGEFHGASAGFDSSESLVVACQFASEQVSAAVGSPGERGEIEPEQNHLMGSGSG